MFGRVPIVVRRRRGKHLPVAEVQSNECVMRILVILLTVAAASQAADKPPYHRLFAGVSQDRVYAALVRSAGSTLASHDRSACLVNLRSISAVGQYYRAVTITATCRNVEGGVLVELHTQTSANEFFAGRYRDAMLRRYWNNIEHELGR